MPKLIPGAGGGGGGTRQEADYNLFKVTSPSHVRFRLTSGETPPCPLELWNCCQETPDDEGGCLLSICPLGAIFPWMTSRTPDSNQSGKSLILKSSFYVAYRARPEQERAQKQGSLSPSLQEKVFCHQHSNKGPFIRCKYSFCFQLAQTASHLTTC